MKKLDESALPVAYLSINGYSLLFCQLFHTDVWAVYVCIVANTMPKFKSCSLLKQHVLCTER